MKTNVVLNEQLVSEAMKPSHPRTKNEVVDMALLSFAARLKRQNMKSLFGKEKWEGDLKKMRVL